MSIRKKRPKRHKSKKAKAKKKRDLVRGAAKKVSKAKGATPEGGCATPPSRPAYLSHPDVALLQRAEWAVLDARAARHIDDGHNLTDAAALCGPTIEALMNSQVPAEKSSGLRHYRTLRKLLDERNENETVIRTATMDAYVAEEVAKLQLQLEQETGGEISPELIIDRILPAVEVKVRQVVEQMLKSGK